MPEPNIFLGLDEFEKDGFFTMTFLLIERAAVPGFVEDWRLLQNLVRVVLLEEYPSGTDTIELLNGALPEIHAEPMFNSQGRYRKYRSGEEPPTDKEYYLKHYHWLETALRIFKKWRLKFHSVFFYFGGVAYNKLTPEARAGIGQGSLRLFQDLANNYSSDARVYNARALDNLSNDVYFHHLTGALTVIEDHLDRAGRYGRLFCDVRGKYGHRFTKTAVFKELRKGGYFMHLEDPVFLSSKNHELLQAADVVGYVAGRHYYTEERGGRPNPILERWWNDYVKDAKEASIRNLQKTQRPAIAIAIELGVAAETCILDTRIRDDFRQDIGFVIGHLLEGRDVRNTMRALGIPFEDP